MLSINYFIIGTPHGNGASVCELSSDSRVQHLLDTICEKNVPLCKPFGANSLNAYNVSICDDDLAEGKWTDDELNDMCTSLMRPAKRLQKYFGEKLSEDDVHVLIKLPMTIAESPTAPIAHTKQLITNAFPDGLPYQKPKPLLATSGLAWEYQPAPDLKQQLREAIKNQYANFQKGQIDKTTVPLYLFLSGAGTGKSRNATEFHQTAVECLGTEDEELKNKLRDAWVFHVGFENGTSLKPGEPDPERAIGSRMLMQLLSVSLENIIDNYEAPFPGTVLELVAKNKKQELKDATIIIVIDGMQNVMDSYEDGMNANTPFYRTLTAIGDLGHRGAFLLACCTATIVRPIQQSLKPSNRLRIYLPVAPLEPPTIRKDGIARPAFEMGDTLMKILVGDCGGHGRALEVLWNLTKGLDLDNCDVGGLMRNLRDTLTGLYESALSSGPDEIRAIARAVLLHQRLVHNHYIPNTKLFPDQVAAPGLINYETSGGSGFLHAPYIWLWVMTERIGGEFGWQFDDYSDILAKGDRTLPDGCSWENFEKFNARFRCLKSLILEEGQPTKISQVHFGARLKGDIAFTNHHLDTACAMNQIDTRTTNQNFDPWLINSTKERIDIRQHRHIVINAKSAPAGDAFLSLDSQSPANEVHQYKLYNGNTTLTQQDYEKERMKAASNQDFFILFTTQEKACNINLPKNSGIVDGRQNWQKYFGPFAGRAFVYVEGSPNINKAGLATLQLVNGVGPAAAGEILRKRPFSSIEDAEERTKLKRAILENFQY